MFVNIYINLCEWLIISFTPFKFGKILKKIEIDFFILRHKLALFTFHLVDFVQTYIISLNVVSTFYNFQNGVKG
jgi:hypothetical protein